jgi:hypothetical protein
LGKHPVSKNPALSKQKAAPVAEGGEFNHFALRGDCLNMNLFSR